MRLQFILSEIGLGLRRNLSMTISVVLVTFVSLTFVGSAALLQMQIGKMKDDWYDKVEVSVFLCPRNSPVPSCAGGEVSADQLASIKAMFGSPELKPVVQNVYFETKDEAFAAFQKRLGDQWWAKSTTVDDMQTSFRVKLSNPAEYQLVSDVLKNRKGVESVEDQSRILEPLFRVLTQATVLSIGLAAVMLLAAALLITTTIRLSALSRKRETGIMRLVGASNVFIQLPFMLEGAIAATIGSALAVGGLLAGVKYLIADRLASQIQFINYVGSAEVWRIAPLLVAIAIIVATVASLVTLSRYTKV
jgi:cell division transport system permease protein